MARSKRQSRPTFTADIVDRGVMLRSGRRAAVATSTLALREQVRGWSIFSVAGRKPELRGHGHPGQKRGALEYEKLLPLPCDRLRKLRPDFAPGGGYAACLKERHGTGDPYDATHTRPFTPPPPASAGDWYWVLLLVAPRVLGPGASTIPRMERLRAAGCRSGRAEHGMGHGGPVTFGGGLAPDGGGRFPELRPALRTESGTAPRVAADEGLARGRAAAGAGRTPACSTSTACGSIRKLTLA